MNPSDIAVLSAQMGVVMGMSPEDVMARMTLREAFLFLSTAAAMAQPEAQEHGPTPDGIDARAIDSLRSTLDAE